MIYNYDQLVKHNKKFYDEFVELKLVGWNSYKKALNDYTFNFFKSQINEVDKAVQSYGLLLKGDGGTAI